MTNSKSWCIRGLFTCLSILHSLKWCGSKVQTKILFTNVSGGQMERKSESSLLQGCWNLYETVERGHSNELHTCFEQLIFVNISFAPILFSSSSTYLSSNTSKLWRSPKQIGSSTGGRTRKSLLTFSSKCCGAAQEMRTLRWRKRRRLTRQIWLQVTNCCWREQALSSERTSSARWGWRARWWWSRTFQLL